MNRLIEAALANRVFANLLMVGLLLAGLSSLGSLTVKTFPDIQTGAISIVVPYPGATPREASDAIVEPIENQIRAIEGVRKLTAVATPGLAQLTVDLERGADLDSVRDEIETQVAGIRVFPEAAEAPVITEIEAEELAIQFLLAGSRQRVELKDIAAQARRELLAIDGISSVELSGVPEDEIAVTIGADRLRALDLDPASLARTIGAASVDLSGGTLISERERLQLRALGEKSTGSTLAELPVAANEAGTSIRLGDIATIIDGLAETPELTRLDGAPGVFLNVFRKGDERTLATVEAARGFVDETLKPRLPDDITVLEWRNEADNLRGRIDLLTRNAAIGAALIVVLLALALELRIAAWVAAGIGVSFVGTLALMQVFGVTINQLSLFGFILALGIVVDDAIVVGESVYAERQRGTEPEKAARAGATRVARPVFFSVATTIAAFAPLLFLPGTSGSFIAPVAAVVIMVLSMSLLESFFVLPHHLARVSDHEPRRWSPRRAVAPVRDRVGGWLEALANGPVFRHARFCAIRPAFAILASAGVLAGSLALLSSGAVRFVFFPEIEGNFVASRLVLPAGTSQEQTLARAEAIAGAARDTADELAAEFDVAPEEIIEAIAVSVGFASGREDPTALRPGSANAATVDVRIRDADERTFGADTFSSRWRERVGQVAGANELTFSASLVGVGAPVSLQVSAPSDAVRDMGVTRIREALMQRDGVYAVRDSRDAAAREIAITLEPAAESLGLALGDIAMSVRNAVFGATATRVVRDDEEVAVRVRLPQAERETLADLRELPIRVGDAYIPLASLARLQYAPAPTTVTRVDTREIVTVEADVQTQATTGAAETAFVLQQVVPRLREDFPGLQVRVGGEQEEQRRFGPALAQNFALAMFAIYAMLALAFGSYAKPLLVLGTVVFGLVGVLIGHALLGLNLTLLSVFGAIGLSGVIINSSLLMITEIARSELRGPPSADSIAAATASRFRPIVLTTLTTFFGIAPLIAETSLQAQFLIPTAVSLGFGVLAGSFFVCTLVPAYASVYNRLVGDRIASVSNGDHRASVAQSG